MGTPGTESDTLANAVDKNVTVSPDLPVGSIVGGSEPPPTSVNTPAVPMEPQASAIQASNETTVAQGPWQKVAMKMGKMIDFAKNSFVLVADYIGGPPATQVDEPIVNTPPAQAELQVDGPKTNIPVAAGPAPVGVISHAGFGTFTLLVAFFTMIGSIFLNRLAAGTVLPDNEPIKLPIFGWEATIDPPLCMALVLSFITTLCGKMALTKSQLDSMLLSLTQGKSHNRRRRRNNITFGWVLLITVVLVIASMAGYRVWVMNGYRLYWNVPGVFLLTTVVETALALSMAIGLNLFIFPCGDRAFDFVERNWRGVRTAIRFLSGLVAFVALVPVIIFCEVVFAGAVALTWLYETAIEFGTFLLEILARLLVALYLLVTVIVPILAARAWRWLCRRWSKRRERWIAKVADREEERRLRNKAHLADIDRGNAIRMAKAKAKAELKQVKRDAKKRLHDSY